MNKTISAISIFLFCIPVLRGADLIHYNLVTDQIMVLVFDDGFINYHGINEAAWNDDEPFISRIDLEKATNASSYTITSSDDPDYALPRQPVIVGRKSKGADFSPVNNTVIIHEHYIYLKFPSALNPGSSYIINLSGLAANADSLEFLYEPQKSFSPAVHINMVGYSTIPDLKFGYVYQWMGDLGPLELTAYEGNLFHLLNSSNGDTAFTGKLTLRKDLETGEPDTYAENDSYNYTMADVYECDFSSFNDPGEYNLYVEGIGCSYPFEIKEDAYREAFRQTARGLFHQRSGPERTVPLSSWYKGVDHMPGVNGFDIEYSTWRIMDGSNAFEELPANATGEVFPSDKGEWMPDNPKDWGWGGYFDAGDFDRRHVHMLVSEYLLLAYELKPENFVDNELKIPENNNDIPDIIDEARWAIDMQRRLQGPTGGICGGMEENEHPRPGENSFTDSRPWFVYAEEPAASYHLAAANAQLAWCLALAGDVNESDSLISQAERVYQWAKDNVRTGDQNKVETYRMRAASWLFRYTGKNMYNQQFTSDYKKGIWDNFAAYAYVLNDHPSVDESIRRDLKYDIFGLANKQLVAGKKRSDRWANIDLYTIHRVGGASTPYIFPLIMTYELTGQKEYLDYAYTTADYFMGGNPINKVYVTGLGEDHVENILHKDSWYDGIDEMVPGIVPYGFHTYGQWMEANKGNIYHPLANFESCYPDWHTWPSHEVWFENRYLIIQNEFTVQQTQGPATGAYAYLCGPLHEPDTRVEAVVLNYDTLMIEPGNAARILPAVKPYDAENKKVSWSSEDESIVTIAGGVIRSWKEGTAYVYVRTDDGSLSDSCLIISEKIIPVAGIDILEHEVEVVEGETDTLHAEISPFDATYPTFTWSSEDTSIVRVNENGIISAVMPGTTNVLVETAEGNFTDECLVRVIEDPQNSVPIPVTRDSRFKIYPNPGKDFFFILTEEGLMDDLDILITQLDGKNISSYKIQGRGKKEFRVDMTNFSAGIYFLHVASGKDKKYEVIKLMKMQ